MRTSLRRLAIPVTTVVLLAGAVLMLMPFVWMISASFKSLQEVMRIPPTFLPDSITLENYREVFRQQPYFGRFFLNSVIAATIVVGAVLLTSSMAGYALAKFRFRGRNIIFVMILATLMVPFEVRVVPLYVMVAGWRLSDTYLGLTLPVMVDAFGIFLMRQFMMSVPNDLTDAARIDGASEIRTFTRIVLPLVTPALSALAIFTLIANWESFLWPLLITNVEQMRTLPIGLSLFAGRYLQRVDLQMAASSIAVIPVVLVFFALQRRFIEGITMTGIKG